MREWARGRWNRSGLHVVAQPDATSVAPRARSRQTWERITLFLWGPGPQPSVTIGIAVVLCVIFGFERLSGSWQHEITNLRHAWGWSLVATHDGEWWRVVTPSLLHSDASSPLGPLGFVHLSANVFALLVFGPRFERRHGHAIVAGAFVSLHIAAFSVWAITDTAGSYFGIGASGAIVALAAVVLVDAIRVRAWRYMAGAAVFAAWFWMPHGSTSSDQVHLVGAIAGVCFGILAAWPWITLTAIAAVGCIVVAMADPVTPHAPHRLPCPDHGYDTTTADSSHLYVGNNRDESVDVYWIRPNGSRDFLAQLGRGDYLIESSYVGARFVVTADRGSCLDVLEAP